MARTYIVPPHVPDENPVSAAAFVQKKGRWKLIPVAPEQRTLGRIAWIPIQDPDGGKPRRFPYYWNIYGQNWKLVRSGPRPQPTLSHMSESNFMVA